jgi:anti-anti-sigma regulatory factor
MDQMHWHIEKRDEQNASLRLSGSLTVQNAGELRKALLEALSTAEIVELELGDHLEIDIAGLQLLCSAHRSFLAKRRKLLLKRRPESFQQTLAAAGLERHHGCSRYPHDGCLWAGE